MYSSLCVRVQQFYTAGILDHAYLKINAIKHLEALHTCRQGDKVARELNARIAALKEDNYEEYLKLAANTKNMRLRTLLEKTGSIIEELGLKVPAYMH